MYFGRINACKKQYDKMNYYIKKKLKCLFCISKVVQLFKERDLKDARYYSQSKENELNCC
jgi:hypothetical protein